MTTHMHAEICEIPQAARRLADTDPQEQFRAVARRLAKAPPEAMVTIARGSSDHAATCLKYAFEIIAGQPVASVRPSVVSRFGAAPFVKGAFVLAISQSGSSQDISQVSAAFAASGAYVLALTNTENSPLGKVATHSLQVRAGPEKAVAATKSFVNSVLSGLWILAHWTGDTALRRALLELPDRLAASLDRPSPDLRHLLETAERGFVVARGPSFGIAHEIALKMIEVCGIHASAYSAAEVWHGPAAILRADMPMIVLEPSDDAAEKACALGVRPVVVPVPEGAHPMLGGLEQLVVAYTALEEAARLRGRDPDRPPNLKKETITL